MQAKATETENDWRRTKRAGQHGHIIADARTLGVHRTTLWRLLCGKVSNPALLARYNDLIRLRSRTTNPDHV